MSKAYREAGVDIEEGERAVEAMKHGAFDYILTPLDFTEVERFCILMAREQQMQKERRSLEDRLAEATGTTPTAPSRLARLWEAPTAVDTIPAELDALRRYV